MSKYFIIFTLIFITLTGFTQPDTNPRIFSNTFSLTDNSFQYTPYGLLYYSLYTGNEVSLVDLSGNYQYYLIEDYDENKILNSGNFLTCLQSWICSSVLFSDNDLGCYLTFGMLCLEQFPEISVPSPSNSDLHLAYGIGYRLISNEESSSKNLLLYEQPVFDISTLHKDEVIQELLKQLRLQEFDFSGVIQDFYRPGTMPGID